jgi:putative CocE/NonD family hydrolase
LVRTGYGREVEAGWFGRGFAFLLHRFVERGYHVVLQTTRGRFNSQGDFAPLLNAREDGATTLAWLARQPWFNGVAGMWGPSWLGYMQWAAAIAAPPFLKAIVPSITASQMYDFTFPDGAFALDKMLRWVTEINLDGVQGRPVKKRSTAENDGILTAAYSHLPLIETDMQAVGEALPYYRANFEHPQRDDPFWQSTDLSNCISAVTAPALQITGWYDFFLRETLADYATLRAAGRNPYLTIGPWAHTALPVSMESMRLGLAWFDAHLKGNASRLPAQPLQVYVLGGGIWRGMESWPPPSRPVQWFLQSDHQLRLFTPVDDNPPSVYRYNPADPTPALGGAFFSARQGGARDNRPLEARSDVVYYTSPELENDVEIMGAPRVTLYVRSSRPHTDFFARICDVYPDRRSFNITDGLLRLAPGVGETQPDGTLRIELPLWPTACRFGRGHRIRLQVSSGAHPRWSRNLGTGEAIGTGTRMLCAEQRIYHDHMHLSHVTLPVTSN